MANDNRCMIKKHILIRKYIIINCQAKWYFGSKIKFCYCYGPFHLSSDMVCLYLNKFLTYLAQNVHIIIIIPDPVFWLSTA